MPPPLGDITLEEVTAPDTVLSFLPERWCDESVPGFMAIGTSSLSRDGILAWYDDRFGPRLPEVTARKNALRGPAGGVSVYQDIQVSLGSQGSATRVRVLTYATTSSDCLVESDTAWDSANASAYVDVCGRSLVRFWGDDYGRSVPQDPPASWAVMVFDEGRAISHDIEKPTVIYVKDGIDADWYEYEIVNRCGLD